jgi:hypothetical protein
MRNVELLNEIRHVLLQQQNNWPVKNVLFRMTNYTTLIPIKTFVLALVVVTGSRTTVLELQI